MPSTPTITTPTPDVPAGPRGPELAALPDEELVRQTRAGQRAAFDALVERHHGAVYAVAQARLRDRDAAEDLAQEVFLRAWLQIARLTAPPLFARWVVCMARNLALDWLRRGASRSRLLPMLSLDAETMAEPPDLQTPRPDAGLLDRERQATLDRALGSLPPDLRELVLLHFSAGLSQSEISRRLGVHPATVGRRLERAMELLRTAMALAEALPREPASPPVRPGGTRPALQPDLVRAQLAPRPAAVARTVVVIGAAAALGPTAKAALAAQAAQGTAASAAAAALPVAGGAATLGQFLVSLPALIAGGVQSMGFIKTAVTLAAAATLTGGYLIAHDRGSTPPPATSATAEPWQESDPGVKTRTQGKELISFIPTGKTMRLRADRPGSPVDQVEATAQADGNCRVLMLKGGKTQHEFLLGPTRNQETARYSIAPGVMFSLRIIPESNLFNLDWICVQNKPTGVELTMKSNQRPDLLPQVVALRGRVKAGQLSRIQMMEQIANLCQAEGLLPTDPGQLAAARSGVLNTPMPF